jgi:hypothetical protein
MPGDSVSPHVLVHLGRPVEEGEVREIPAAVRIQAAACWEAVESGKLKIGELEHSVIMNATRSHLGGGEDCSRGCGYRAGLLDRKVTQVHMEILVKKEWIWWSKTGGKVTTASGEMALASRRAK